MRPAQTKQVVCLQPHGRLPTIHDRTQMKLMEKKQMLSDFVTREHFGVVRRVCTFHRVISSCQCSHVFIQFMKVVCGEKQKKIEMRAGREGGRVSG